MAAHVDRAVLALVTEALHRRTSAAGRSVTLRIGSVPAQALVESLADLCSMLLLELDDMDAGAAFETLQHMALRRLEKQEGGRDG